MSILLKKIIAFIMSAIVALTSFAGFSRRYRETHETFRFLGNTYEAYNDSRDNFIPFGDDHCFFNDRVSFKNVLSLSYCKENKDRNFIYDRMIQSITYIKQGYHVPELPSVEQIDAFILRVFIGDDCKEITIKNQTEIKLLMSYISIKEDGEQTIKDGDMIAVYALSYSIGGVYSFDSFYIAQVGNHHVYEYKNELVPKEISDLFDALL